MRQPTAAELALLTTLYAAFNGRDIDAAVATMTRDVRWPKAFEGGFAHGHDGVRDYWTGQWAEIDPNVEPTAFDREADGRVFVTVRLLVKAITGEVLTDGPVGHRFTFRGGLVRTMEVCPPPGPTPPVAGMTETSHRGGRPASRRGNNPEENGDEQRQARSDAVVGTVVGTVVRPHG